MKSFEDMTTEELINYWHGRLCLGIGEGDSRGVISLMVMSLQTLGFDRGVKRGKEMAKKGK